MSGSEFQEYVAEALRRNGYSVTLTKVTGDFGVDLVAIRGAEKAGNDILRVAGDRFAEYWTGTSAS